MTVVTSDLSKFGYRELAIAAKLLDELSNGNCPDDFDQDGVTLNFNLNSGLVFLSNENYQVVMMNDEKLESFYSSPYEGKEGFWSDLIEEYPDMHHEDQQWMRDIANGRELPDLDKE